MKALLVNGSPRADGNTARALEEVASTLRACGVETETVPLGVKPVRGCIACGRCRELGRCAFADDVADVVALKATVRRPVRKRRLFGANTGLAMYEGICLGPALADGSRSVLLISDGGDGAANRLLALKLRF